MTLLEKLEALSDANGVNGMTGAIDVAADLLREYSDDVIMSDQLGNVIGWIRCGKPEALVLMLEAHIDEIGLIATGVDDAGFVRVDRAGAVDPRTLAASEVVIYADPPLPGIFCSTPPHLAAGDHNVPDITAMGIDVGLSAEKAKKRIPPGTRIGFKPGFRRLLGTRVCGKSLDDRAGVAAILHCLELLKDQELSCDLAVVFATGEELGCRGSGPAAFGVDPDFCVAVDVSFAATPDSDPNKCGILGKGPMIGVSPVLDYEMSGQMVSLAAKAGIPFQYEVMAEDTGTDADRISLSRMGVPCSLLSIPLRYMHTAVETADMADIENTGKLIAEYVKSVESGERRVELLDQSVNIQQQIPPTAAYVFNNPLTQLSTLNSQLSTLSSLPGVSGREDAVREYILNKLKSSPAQMDVKVDALGNILVDVKGRASAAQKVLFAAHMDEVGLIITHITADGFLRFAAVGGVDPAVLIGRRVKINVECGVWNEELSKDEFITKTQTNTAIPNFEFRIPNLISVIGCKAIHHCSADDKKTLPKIEQLLIDIGAEDNSQFTIHNSQLSKHPTDKSPQTVPNSEFRIPNPPVPNSEFRIPNLIGASAVFDSDYTVLGGDRFKAKALDDRAGCALLLELVKEIPPYDLTLAFTVQEEVGLRGAGTAAFAVQPDIAVIVDATTAGDVVGVPEEKHVCKLGYGPVVSFMDKRTMYDKKLYDQIMAIAAANGIPAQPKTVVAGGNDAGAMQTAGAGCRVAAVSLPCRYLHSPSCVLSEADVEATRQLLLKLAEILPGNGTGKD